MTSSQADAEENYSGGTGVSISSKKKNSGLSAGRQKKCSQSEGASSNAKNISESSDSENGHVQDTVSSSHSIPPKTKSVKKGGIGKRNSKRMAERVLVSMQKRQKKTVASDSSIVSGILFSHDLSLTSIIAKIVKKHVFYHINMSNFFTLEDVLRCVFHGNLNMMQGEALDHSSNQMVNNPPVISNEDNMRKEEFVGENDCQQELTDNKSWKPLEKGLLDKGMEIFGRNR